MKTFVVWLYDDSDGETEVFLVRADDVASANNKFLQHQIDEYGIEPDEEDGTLPFHIDIGEVPNVTLGKEVIKL